MLQQQQEEKEKEEEEKEENEKEVEEEEEEQEEEDDVAPVSSGRLSWVFDPVIVTTVIIVFDHVISKAFVALVAATNYFNNCLSVCLCVCS